MSHRISCKRLLFTFGGVALVLAGIVHGLHAAPPWQGFPRSGLPNA